MSDATNQSAPSNASSEPSRRGFLKTGVIATGLAASLPISRSAHAQGSDAIRVGLIGCGGRGTGAAGQALDTNSESNRVKLTAVADPFKFRADNALKELKGKHKENADAKAFIGVDSYKEVLASDVDLVILTSPPGFRPLHFEAAVKAGKHVFMEKPIADSVEGALRVAEAARLSGSKLVIGYILRHHPSWIRFIDIARELGKPLVMRMNLNQQSSGDQWKTHQALMRSMSPIVDCGVHYVDVMCQMTRSRPIRVSAIGARLTDELVPGMYNYGQLQVTFADGSVGWYEAGWGPMMSDVAYFLKDVIGPRGCVSIAGVRDGDVDSDDIGAHSRAALLRIHHADLQPDGTFARQDELIDCSNEPDHDGLCLLEQQFFLDAIRRDRDLGDHMADAVNSLRIVLAADEAFRTGRTVDLPA
jgi:predicted dehydrogenase